MDLRKFFINLDVYRLLYVYLLIRMLFSKYAINSLIWDMAFFTISTLFLIKYVARNIKGSRLVKEFIFACVVLLIVFGINIYYTGSSQYWVENYFDLLKNNYIVVVLVCMIIVNRSKFVECLESSFFFLNAFGVLNLIIVTLQELFHGFMIRADLLALNGYYPDLCAGFFGFNGTHRMTYFYCFLTIYDLYMIKYRKKSNRKFYLIYIPLMVVWNIIVSKGNENTSFVAVLILYLILYYANIAYVQNGLMSVRFLRKLIYPLFGLFFLIYAYSLNISGSSKGKLINKINLALHANGNDARGGSERIGIIVQSFYDGVALRMGYGVGKNKWLGNTHRFVGFRHFGISSASSFIALGGVLFYLVVCIIVLRWINKTYLLSNRSLFCLTTATVLILSTLYTDIITNDLTIFWLTMYVAIISFASDRIMEGKAIHVYSADKCYCSDI